MWNRGGRSTALERAQALLSGRRTQSAAESRDLININSAAITPTKAVSGDGSSKKRATAAPPTRQTPFLDLSDLCSSASSGVHCGDGTTGSAAATAGERQGREGGQAPQSGGGGGGSRFLKKAASPAASSQSQPSSVLSTQRSSQSAALSRLAAIEDRIRSRKHAQTPAQGQTRAGPTATPAQTLASDLGIPPPPPQPQDTSTPLSTRSSSDLSLKGKRFLKRTTASAAADSTTSTAAVPPKDPGVRFQTPAADTAYSLGNTRRAGASVPLARLGAEPIRVVGGGVSLDSDEEDMRRLLGDSPDWTEDSLRRVRRTSSMTTAVKPLGKSSHKISPISPATVIRSSSVRPLPRFPPPRQGSPRRLHWSPSPSIHSASVILSLSPSPPYSSLSSPPGAGPGSSSWARVPPHSLYSSISGHNEVVRSLEELFPMAPGDSEEEAPSERSEASSAALSAHSPAVFALNDMLRQQLALTRHFIHTNRHMYSSLLHSLGTADYTYTTLEDTKEFIHKHKPPKLTVEEALEEVLQEMRDYHYI